MAETTQERPQTHLLQTLFAFMATRTLSAVAELNVPDALAASPCYYTDLAQKVGADQRSLHRAMRLLSSIGLFAEPTPGTFALTPVSELLRSDVPGSMRDMAVMLTSESHWQPWGRLTDTLRSGKSGPQHAFGTDMFSWFQRTENRDQWDLFNAAMTSFSSATSEAIATSYDFNRFRQIVDIGGGHGLLLRRLLATAPHATGIVFDLPEVVAGVSETLDGRLSSVGGDFFKAVPAGADCYIMKHIIHDWSDDHCRTLLSNVAEVMQPEGRVLVCETVMPDTPEPHPAKFMDINMLALTEGGTERTEREFAALFTSVGLTLRAIHPTESPVSIVEGAKSNTP